AAAARATPWSCGSVDLAGRLTLRVAVIGGGAVGAVLADAAAGAGHRVQLCVRTPVTRLVVLRNGEQLAPAVDILSDPGEVAGPADV
ncbi:hypothetical protein NL463_28635, partial [Klebsiella pneumoniae]|nr:hypothetical protein [Klebsiella pneumoniae]